MRIEKIGNATLYEGDCLALMAKLPDASVDMILCDLPYGTTACKWDTVIPFEPMWEQLKRVIKPNRAIVMTASQPFTTVLISSNIGCYHHSWVWDKRFAANFPQAKRQPLRVHEDVVVFGKTPRYYPVMAKRDKPIKKGKNAGAEMYGGVSGLGREDYKGKVYDEKYPETVIEFNVRSDGRKLHPTQKPVALMEYLIRTYTHEGETVLDNCMGSGTTGVACANTGRQFIGMELDETYFNTSCKRLRDAFDLHDV